jgi:hypothetical protein
MPKPPRKQLRSLEVAIMFEPNRFEQASLQAAYACLLPVLQRKMNAVQKLQPGAAGQSLKPTEGNAS